MAAVGADTGTADRAEGKPIGTEVGEPEEAGAIGSAPTERIRQPPALLSIHVLRGPVVCHFGSTSRAFQTGGTFRCSRSPPPTNRLVSPLFLGGSHCGPGILLSDRAESQHITPGLKCSPARAAHPPKKAKLPKPAPGSKCSPYITLSSLGGLPRGQWLPRTWYGVPVR